MLICSLDNISLTVFSEVVLGSIKLTIPFLSTEINLSIVFRVIELFDIFCIRTDEEMVDSFVLLSSRVLGESFRDMLFAASVKFGRKYMNEIIMIHSNFNNV